MDPFDYPKWRGEKVNRLLILGEQGIGDEVMFASCFNEVKDYAKEVWIECEPRLAGLFKRSFPWAHIVGREDYRDNSWVKEPFDAKAYFGDLCKRFRKSKKDFGGEAYLTPDPEKVEKWSYLKGYTAISWRGRQGRLDPEKIKQNKAVSLQYSGEQIGNIEQPEWCEVPDIDLHDDIEDVFAILANVDRLVCVPTSVLHFAGSMGVPVDVIMTPGEGEANNALNWRFGMSREMLWHSSVTVYRNYADYRRLQKAA